MVAAIRGTVGKPLRRTIVAQVLVGHTSPEVVALVAHHALPHYGALKGLRRGEVARLIEVICPEPPALNRASPRDMPRPQRGATDGCATPGDGAVTDVVLLIADIRAVVTETISVWPLSHILFGSRGPMVDALRERYHPPHDGVLRPLGIERVKELVRAANRLAREME